MLFMSTFNLSFEYPVCINTNAPETSQNSMKQHNNGFSDQFRLYRSTQCPSVSFKETNEKFTCEEVAENYKTPPSFSAHCPRNIILKPFQSSLLASSIEQESCKIIG